MDKFLDHNLEPRHLKVMNEMHLNAIGIPMGTAFDIITALTKRGLPTQPELAEEGKTNPSLDFGKGQTMASAFGESFAEMGLTPSSRNNLNSIETSTAAHVHKRSNSRKRI